MKQIKINLLLLLSLLISQISFGQRLTLNDIEIICSKANWESVNQFLMNKNWEYYESEKGNSEKYSTITWSFEKTYGDKASAWFYLYTYEGFPNKLSYSVFNKPSYTAIQNSLSSKGYKLQNSQIENNELISSYANSKFILKITTEKREKDSYSSLDESITAYRFLLIKKSSIYDPDNGKKVDYYYGNTKQAEYTKVNGKIDGALKVYYENGQLKKTGYYKNGSANGSFVEYDEEGNKTFEYYQSNDKKNGKLISYEENKISYSTHYKDDIQNGERIEYYYNNETGNLNLKSIGEFLNGDKNGIWKLVSIDEEKKERLLTKTNYIKGVKNGFSQDIKGDSLIMANYTNDKLNGDYKVYIDVGRFLAGGVMRTDTTKLALITQGKYHNDVKVGYWKYYDMTNTLRDEGGYEKGQESGEWKQYYTSMFDVNGGSLPYSKKLFFIQTYKLGKLNGLSKRLSYLSTEKYKCSELDKNNQPKDSCTRMVYEKVLETSYYVNDKLDGPYELRDSLNNIIAKGNFKDDLKNGEWIHRYEDNDFDDRPYHYFMKGSYTDDKREGKWILFFEEGKINKTFNFSNDELHGELTEWNNFNKPKNRKIFLNGKFKELVVYDSLGKFPKRKYEIFDKNSSSYKCRQTIFSSSGKMSLVFWLKQEEEINHNFFDLTFLIKLNNNDKYIIHKHGEYLASNSNEQPLIKGNYFEEYKIGTWTYFYYPQGVKLEIKYLDNNNIGETYLSLDNNLFSGDFTYLNNDENIKEIRSVKNGLRNGKTEFINISSGETIRKVRYKDGQIK